METPFPFDNKELKEFYTFLIAIKCVRALIANKQYCNVKNIFLFLFSISNNDFPGNNEKKIHKNAVGKVSDTKSANILIFSQRDSYYNSFPGSRKNDFHLSIECRVFWTNFAFDCLTFCRNRSDLLKEIFSLTNIYRELSEILYSLF